MDEEPKQLGEEDILEKLEELKDQETFQRKTRLLLHSIDEILNGFSGESNKGFILITFPVSNISQLGYVSKNISKDASLLLLKSLAQILEEHLNQQLLNNEKETV